MLKLHDILLENFNELELDNSITLLKMQGLTKAYLELESEFNIAMSRIQYLEHILQRNNIEYDKRIIQIKKKEITDA